VTPAQRRAWRRRVRAGAAAKRATAAEARELERARAAEARAPSVHELVSDGYRVRAADPDRRRPKF